jgi:hypothetical protein
MSIGREFQSYVAAFVICAVAIAAVISVWKKSEAAVRTSRDELEIRVQERAAKQEHSNREIRERETKAPG